MASNASRKFAVIGIGLVLLLILPQAAQWAGQPQLITISARILAYAIAAVSLDLILGFAGLASFGHAAFFGMGGYVVGILYFHFRAGEPLFGFIPGTDLAVYTLPAAILGSGLLAAVIGALSLRTSGVHFIMITLAFAQMVFFFFVSLKHYGGDDGLIIRRRNQIPFMDSRDEIGFYYVCLGFLVAFLLLCSAIVKSRFGMVLGAVRQNERRLAAIGISTYRYKLVAFVLAGMGCGLAGALFANQARFVSPDMLSWAKSGEIMIMVILGGAGTLFGPVVGAFVLIGLEAGLAGLTEHWQFYLGPILVLIVLFLRRGLWGALVGQGKSDGGGHG
jgi:branched-chain amino acid transport system permease protein